jgi:hypothetical protein
MRLYRFTGRHRFAISSPDVCFAVFASVSMMFLLKLLLVPSLIAVITLAGRRWGPAIAGWLSGFPVVTGPILLLIAIEHGPLFASNAAAWAISAVLANVCFSIGYSWVAVRYPWWICVVSGLISYALAALLLSAFSPLHYEALIITVAGLCVASQAFPRHRGATPAAQPSPAELPARMVAGAALVLAVTFFAENLGPRLSGLFAVFPTMGIALGAFSHVTSGADFAIRLLGGMVSGFYAFAIFCFILAATLPTFGTGLSFLIALACAVIVQAISFWIKSLLQQRRAKPQ